VTSLYVQSHFVQSRTSSASKETSGEKPSSTAVRANTLELERFHGRIGNNLAQLGHLLTFANASGAWRIDLRPAKTRHEVARREAKNRVTLHTMFALPEEIFMQGRAPSDDVSMPEGCSSQHMQIGDGKVRGVWYASPCLDMSALYYHQAFRTHLLPLSTPQLKSCVEDGTSPDEGLLTIHLRGDDAIPIEDHMLDSKAALRSWLFPPCSLYQRIIEDGGFARVLLVTSPDLRNPCVRWLQDLSAASGQFSLQLQSGTVLEDACAILRARHLTLSYSSFGHNLAVMSQHLRTIYTRGVFDEHWLMNCDTWVGVRIVRYDVATSWDRHYPYNESYRGALEWLVTYPAEAVLGPRACHRSECKSTRPNRPIVCNLNSNEEL